MAGRTLSTAPHPVPWGRCHLRPPRSIEAHAHSAWRGACACCVKQPLLMMQNHVKAVLALPQQCQSAIAKPEKMWLMPVYGSRYTSIQSHQRSQYAGHAGHMAFGSIVHGRPLASSTAFSARKPCFTQPPSSNNVHAWQTCHGCKQHQQEPISHHNANMCHCGPCSWQ
jgi:hypothetical protein